MKDVFQKVSTSISEAAKKTSQAVTEVIEHEDTQAALIWAKRTANTVADETARLGKEVARSDMAKDAATGAAIGGAVFAAGCMMINAHTIQKKSAAEVETAYKKANKGKLPQTTRVQQYSTVILPNQTVSANQNITVKSTRIFTAVCIR